MYPHLLSSFALKSATFLLYLDGPGSSYSYFTEILIITGIVTLDIQERNRSLRIALISLLLFDLDENY